MNKSVYIINSVLVTLLYVWIMSLFPFPNLYFLLYAVTSLIFLIVYGKRSRLSPFIPLFTFLYPFLYAIIVVNNVACSQSLITGEAYFSLVGLIPGLLIFYKGKGIGGKIVNGIGIFIAYLYAMLIMFIFINSHPPPFPYLPSNMLETFALDPLFITATFSTARALGYGIPRRKSSNYQNQPPQPIPQSNPQTPYQPNLPQTPSIPLMGRSLSNWDPNVWINRTLSVYKIEKVIGEGGNGYVLKGEYSGKPLAIKVLKLYGGSPEEFFRDLATEASNLVNLSNHKNIVKIYAVNVDTFVIDGILKGRSDLYVKNPPMIVMEYMGGGTLKDLLGEDLFYYSSKWQRNVLRAICGVAEALDYIHSQGFVHMDVKPQNIFLSERPKDPSELDKVTFKLGDLGSAVRINGKVKQITPEYSPPEVFLEPAKPYFDIYALGMTAYVLLTRKMDRPDLNEMNNAIDCYIKRDTNCVRSEVDKARMKLMYWNVNVDPKIDPLLKSMLSIEPLRRPTAREVIDMIKKIDPTICS